MEISEILSDVRAKNHLSQEAFAEKLFVTRQAVSRWENGDSIPNIDTLKRISEQFGISLDELLNVDRTKNDQVHTSPFNTLFADVYTLMENAGMVQMGIGNAKGENKAETTAKMALSSLPMEIVGRAKGIVIYIIIPPEIKMNEINHAIAMITDKVHPNATISFGAAIDHSLTDEMRIALVVTGF